PKRCLDRTNHGYAKICLERSNSSHRSPIRAAQEQRVGVRMAVSLGEVVHLFKGYGTYFMIGIDIETAGAKHAKSVLLQKGLGSRSDYVEVWSHDRNLGCRQDLQRIEYGRRGR